MSEPKFDRDGNYIQSLDLSEPALFVLKRGPITTPSRAEDMAKDIRKALESFDIRHRLVVIGPGDSLESVGNRAPTLQIFPGVTKGPWEEGE